MSKKTRIIASMAALIAGHETYAAEVVRVDASGFARTDRYTLVSMDTQPEQMSPLLAVVNIQFSDNVKTVGDALFELLAGSGYRWDSDAPENQRLLELSLPLVLREIGPMRLQDALNTLVGEAWQLEVDELFRAVRFSVRITN